MNEIDVTRVLTQIRALQTQAGASARPATAAAEPAGSFQTLLTRSLDSVAGAQNESARLQKLFELGESGTDLASVMVAGARAQVQFRAAVEVRNRLVSAYQDIMNMPL